MRFESQYILSNMCEVEQRVEVNAIDSFCARVSLPITGVDIYQGRVPRNVMSLSYTSENVVQGDSGRGE